ncbi:uncharacterized protein HKW66_Vig0238360 [Vigna angularis]|uniref:Uncharacterized protein n=1 Tax=Phaseolus angularis TaxID=3914 RepID=A0A8T0KTR0_PHAAN|nr:uncharacterized protein HKW66_Vig0238360 [Vigna angularis]
MSWVRSAVNKAVEGGPTNIRRAVRTYTDSVVLHASNAVAGGARIIQDRIVTRNMQSFRHTVKRLEEVSISCRGIERVQLLRRWLVALKEVERLTANSIDTDEKDTDNQFLHDEFKDSPTQQPTLVCETLTVSIVSVYYLPFVYNYGQIYYVDPDDVHELKNFRDVFLSSLALEGITLSMTKREELLQYVQTAISGLKAVDKDMVQVVQMCSKLEELLLKKKYFSSGDSPQLHAEKVDKLKVLSESLANSTKKAENRITENRSQKEEALHFRAAKSDEVSLVEKELSLEIEELERQKDELEEKLKKVNNLLTFARIRFHNAKEEREQFDEASNEILLLLKSKEEEMLRAITSYTVEANVVDKWIKFLESTWVFQTSLTKRKDEQVKLAMSSMANIEGLKLAKPRKRLEEEYLDIESKFLAILNVVDTMNKQFHIQKEGIFRKDSDKVKQLFDDIEKIKEEFESIERPKLELEIPTERSQIEIELDKLSEDDSSEEISDWEFDALDNDRRSRR